AATEVGAPLQDVQHLTDLLARTVPAICTATGRCDDQRRLRPVRALSGEESRKPGTASPRSSSAGSPHP
ncbi:MAG: hypothetical protein U9R79_22105, partial [Armatimonadota bacterium]|nr:hypothetical protein [Armatimonadota bacterium]